MKIASIALADIESSEAPTTTAYGAVGRHLLTINPFVDFTRWLTWQLPLWAVTIPVALATSVRAGVTYVTLAIVSTLVLRAVTMVVR